METDAEAELLYGYGTMSNWLQTALKTAGMSQAELSRQLTKMLGRSIDRAAINKIAKGTRRIQADEAMAIIRLTGAHLPPEMTQAFPDGGYDLLAPRRGTDVEGFDQVELTRLPIRGEVAAGRWLETPAFLDWNEISDYVDGISVPPSQRQYTYGLVVRGTSVNKIAQDGEVIVCLDAASGVEVHERDVVVVERVRDDGALREVTAKRLIRRDGVLVLMPESTDPMWQTPIPIEDLDHEDTEIRIVAKVKFVIRPV